MKNIRIRRGGPPDRESLLAMYRDFEPPGAALGLPPFFEAGRRGWIDRLLSEAFHWIVVDGDGRFLGHTVLANSGPREAEIAFFVHQSSRCRRIGTLLVVAALAEARKLGYQRVWALVCADNIPALKLLQARGFRRSRISPPTIELELLLQQPRPVTVASRPKRSGVAAEPSLPGAGGSKQSAVGLNEPHPARF